jgi:hypothetical protein
MAGKLFSHASARSAFALILTTLFTFLITAVFSGCGGKGGSAPPPSNVGGGFTLVASGGTLNDGSGVKGLSVLTTLRDNQGWGPTQVWTITITDPDSNILTAEYNDQRLGSYMNWEWAGFDPSPGTYHAAATNGIVTISYDFSVTSDVIQRPAPNATSSPSAITVAWPSVAGAGSYSYQICTPASTCVSDLTTLTSETVSFSTLTAGDYFIRVKAYATDRPALYADHAASPGLASHENISEYSFSFPIGGDQNSGNYSLHAAGGVVDYGLRGPGNIPIYGIAFWSSILFGTPTPNAAPDGDWNITIKNSSNVTIADFIYPKGSEHYAYWYYGIEPATGSYTVTATYGTASRTASFTIDNSVLTSHLALPAGISATKTGSDINLTWNAVTLAKSYYVSLYAIIWDASAKQYDYREVWGKWVSTAGTTILKSGSTIPAGLEGDVYVTAYEVDMAAAAPPGTTPARADMSENLYGYPLPFLTP